MTKRVHATQAEVDAAMIAFRADERSRGLDPASEGFVLSLLRAQIEREKTGLLAAAPAPRGTIAPGVRSAQPIAKPAPRPMPVKPVTPSPSAAVLAERARAQKIIAMTPKGAEAECQAALRSGDP
ncbi:hypothetical protein [Methylobacterium soli]|uniref:Uncharacterized protein n=1 Tax=Methylobacterium soli TaxID=553447 RepID=A0A6L3T222_9HYPH|nr:hypothetical protein [Methylobacterium soli]KAB1078822.1 hypothetical protein F6X53_12455 [Methylobacterium soli]GJE41606.1 hypothetical protein AEGHOMDF_0772 [Methylobacterium soli]